MVRIEFTELKNNIGVDWEIEGELLSNENQVRKGRFLLRLSNGRIIRLISRKRGAMRIDWIKQEDYLRTLN